MPRRRPLTDRDIIRYTSGVPFIRGPFMRDTLPKKPWKNECGVVNLDLNENEGTHWVAYRKNNNFVVYFDSFGNLRPPVELERYFVNCKIAYNHNRLQEFSSTNCGQLCIKFLHFQLPHLLLRNL